MDKGVKGGRSGNRSHITTNNTTSSRDRDIEVDSQDTILRDDDTNPSKGRHSTRGSTKDGRIVRTDVVTVTYDTDSTDGKRNDPTEPNSSWVRILRPESGCLFFFGGLNSCSFYFVYQVDSLGCSTLSSRRLSVWLAWESVTSIVKLDSSSRARILKVKTCKNVEHCRLDQRCSHVWLKCHNSARSPTPRIGITRNLGRGGKYMKTQSFPNMANDLFSAALVTWS